MMERDEHFSARGISGAQMASGSGRGKRQKDDWNSRNISFRVGG